MTRKDGYFKKCAANSSPTKEIQKLIKFKDQKRIKIYIKTATYYPIGTTGNLNIIPNLLPFSPRKTMARQRLIFPSSNLGTESTNRRKVAIGPIYVGYNKSENASNYPANHDLLNLF